MRVTVFGCLSHRLATRLFGRLCLSACLSVCHVLLLNFRRYWQPEHDSVLSLQACLFVCLSVFQFEIIHATTTACAMLICTAMRTNSLEKTEPCTEEQYSSLPTPTSNVQAGHCSSPERKKSLIPVVPNLLSGRWVS